MAPRKTHKLFTSRRLDFQKVCSKTEFSVQGVLMGLRCTHGIDTCGREKRKQEWEEGEAGKALTNPFGSSGVRMAFRWQGLYTQSTIGYRTSHMALWN